MKKGDRVITTKDIPLKTDDFKKDIGTLKKGAEGIIKEILGPMWLSIQVTSLEFDGWLIPVTKNQIELA